MPAFNSSKTIRHSIESVLAQTHSKYELIVIDDGSSDETYRICSSYCDPRIKLLKQKNRGLAGARNTGIRAAIFDTVAFIDSDDLWMANKLELHLRHLYSNKSLGVSFSRSKFIDQNGEIIGNFQMPNIKNIDAKLIFCRNPISNGSCVVLKKCVLDDIEFEADIYENVESYWFDDSFRQSEDIECWLRIALTSKWKFEGIPEALTIYRVNNNGLSADTKSQLQSWKKVVDKVESYNSLFIQKYYKQALSYQLRYLSRREVYLNNKYEALSLYFSAFSAWPYILIKEPCKSITTLVAILIKIILPKHTSLAIEKFSMNLVGKLQYLRIKWGSLLSRSIESYNRNQKIDILVVCSAGGHYSACKRFKGFFDSYPHIWVTFKTITATTELSKERTYWAFHPTNRNIWNLLRNLGLSLFIILKHNPKLILTTGAGVSVPFVLIGKLLMKKTIFIESITRSSKLSLSAKLCLPFLDKCIVQWPNFKSYSSKIVELQLKK